MVDQVRFQKNPSQRSKEGQRNRHRRRPGSITLLAWLHFFQSLALLGFAVYLYQKAGGVQTPDDRALQFLPLALFEGMLSSAVLVVLALLGVYIAVALLRLKSWAWLAAMSLQGLGLMAALYAYSQGRPNYLGMAIGIFLVLFLNQKDVQAVFRGKREFQFPQRRQGERA